MVGYWRKSRQGNKIPTEEKSSYPKAQKVDGGGGTESLSLKPDQSASSAPRVNPYLHRDRGESIDEVSTRMWAAAENADSAPVGEDVCDICGGKAVGAAADHDTSSCPYLDICPFDIVVPDEYFVKCRACAADMINGFCTDGCSCKWGRVERQPTFVLSLACLNSLSKDDGEEEEEEEPKWTLKDFESDKDE